MKATITKRQTGLGMRIASIAVDEFTAMGHTASVTQYAQYTDGKKKPAEVGWFSTSTNNLNNARAMITAIQIATEIAQDWNADDANLEIRIPDSVQTIEIPDA